MSVTENKIPPPLTSEARVGTIRHHFFVNSWSPHPPTPQSKEQNISSCPSSSSWLSCPRGNVPRAQQWLQPTFWSPLSGQLLGWLCPAAFTRAEQLKMCYRHQRTNGWGEMSIWKAQWNPFPNREHGETGEWHQSRNGGKFPLNLKRERL